MVIIMNIISHADASRENDPNITAITITIPNGHQDRNWRYFNNIFRARIEKPEINSG